MSEPPSNISARAREAAMAELKDNADWIPGHERPNPYGFHVQQALDAERVDTEKEWHGPGSLLRQLQDDVAALTRQRDELKAENAHLEKMGKDFEASMLEWTAKFFEAEKDRDEARSQLAAASAQVTGMREALARLDYDGKLSCDRTSEEIPAGECPCSGCEARKALSSAPSGGSGDLARLEVEMEAILSRCRKAMDSEAIEGCAPAEIIALLISQRDNARSTAMGNYQFYEQARQDITSLEKDKADALAQYERLRAAVNAPKWDMIETAPREGRCEKFLVTNNIEARTASGHMSHVWLVDMVHKNGADDYTAFEDFRELSGLTHWKKVL